MTNQNLVSRTTRAQVASMIDAVDPVGPKPGGEVLGARRFVGVAPHILGQIRLDQPQHRTGKYPFGKRPRAGL